MHCRLTVTVVASRRPDRHVPVAVLTPGFSSRPRILRRQLASICSFPRPSCLWSRTCHTVPCVASCGKGGP